MDLQQVKTDLDSNVLISDSTWKKVLDTAIKQADVQEQLVAALKKIASSDAGEGGCYYTNRVNIHRAKEALASAGAK